MDPIEKSLSWISFKTSLEWGLLDPLNELKDAKPVMNKIEHLNSSS